MKKTFRQGESKKKKMVPHLFNLADLPTYLVLYQPWLGTGTEYALLWTNFL